MSEWRQGQVESAEAGGPVVVKPLAGQDPQAQDLHAEQHGGEHDEEEEEEGEQAVQ